MANIAYSFGIRDSQETSIIKVSNQTLTRLSQDEKELNEITPDFFKQIKLNYQQLDREYEKLCVAKDKEHIGLKKRKVLVSE